MATKGFKELVLIPALREQGFSVRKARATINAILKCMKDALHQHETLELPIGTFTPKPRTGQKRERKFGKVVTMADYKIDFQPSPEPSPAVTSAPAAPPRPTRPKPLKRKQVPAKSDLTLSTELIVEFVRGNVEAGNWVPFFNELRRSPSSLAWMNQFRPEADQLRPLGEAAQVIDECAPEEMPEDSWDRLAACHEWFARWTRRVIPLALWQQAMHTAEKTLLPKT